MTPPASSTHWLRPRRSGRSPSLKPVRRSRRSVFQSRLNSSSGSWTITSPGPDIAAVVLKKRPRVLGRNEPAQRRLSRPEAVEGERLGLSAKAAHGAGESYGPLVILELQPDIEARAKVVGVVVANQPKRDALTAGPKQIAAV